MSQSQIEWLGNKVVETRLLKVAISITWLVTRSLRKRLMSWVGRPEAGFLAETLTRFRFDYIASQSGDVVSCSC